LQGVHVMPIRLFDCAPPLGTPHRHWVSPYDFQASRNRSAQLHKQSTLCRRARLLPIADPYFPEFQSNLARGGQKQTGNHDNSASSLAAALRHHIGHCGVERFFGY
jgi:hypothetical protein